MIRILFGEDGKRPTSVVDNVCGTEARRRGLHFAKDRNRLPARVTRTNCCPALLFCDSLVLIEPTHRCYRGKNSTGSGTYQDLALRIHRKSFTLVLFGHLLFLYQSRRTGNIVVFSARWTRKNVMFHRIENQFTFSALVMKKKKKHYNAVRRTNDNGNSIFLYDYT